ncbi:MAG: VWA domain-containing protein [Bacteroidota bacterium]
MLSAEEEALALQTFQFIDYTSRSVFQSALKAILCRTKTQTDEFDHHFTTYWNELENAVDSKIKSEPKNKNQLKREAAFKSINTWLHGNREKETEEIATYSSNENLLQKDFSSVPEDEANELMQCIKSLSKRLAAKTSRRYERSHKMDLPDLRKTLRKNMRRGGELLDIIHKRPKRNRVKLVVLCDVSKSMDLYAAFLIQFMHAFQQVFRHMDTFVFSTNLLRITSILKQKSFRDAMQLLSNEDIGWSGGTRIGESLNAFINEFGKKVLDSKTIVIILSDGWDTGNIDLLENSMAVISKKSKKTIWLNPLAGNKSYRHEVAGMKAAIPYIDVFAAVHNAESLRQISKWL